MNKKFNKYKINYNLKIILCKKLKSWKKENKKSHKIVFILNKK